MKVGIIRCQQTEDMCSGYTDFKVAGKGHGVFKEVGPVEILGFVSCGGCPGKRAVSRVEEMAKDGAEAIVLASCIGKGTPIGMACPHFAEIKKAIIANVPETVKVFDWSH